MTVRFAPGVLDSIRERCAGQDLETGGILIGQVMNGDVRVVYAPPMPEDSKRTPRGFERGRAGLDEFLSSLGSSGLIYLGEWHSHPCGPSWPSNQDVAATLDLEKDLEQSVLLLIMGGCDGKDPSLYQSNRNFMRLDELGVPETLKADAPIVSA